MYSLSLYSPLVGGADRRMVGYSMEKSVPFLTKRFDEKVCSIIENPTIPDLLLISYVFSCLFVCLFVSLLLLYS